MSASVTPRTTRTQVEASKRWSAPPRSRSAGRAVRAPDEVLRDVRGLKMRQRVSLALSDDVLRGELEDMLSTHSDRPINADAFRTYQDFLIPSGGVYGGGFAGLSASVIADIRGADTLHYSKFERQLRCKVASVYRLMQLFGWGKGVSDRAACTVRLKCLNRVNVSLSVVFISLFILITVRAIANCGKDYLNYL